MPVEDSYIAAIAIRHNLTVATGNEKDFRRPGTKLFNPFEETRSADRAKLSLAWRLVSHKQSAFRRPLDLLVPGAWFADAPRSMTRELRVE